jgi:hypothetical protein
MTHSLFEGLAKQVRNLALAAMPLMLGACSAGTNCALFGLQCGAPTADQEARAAATEATLKEENAVLGPKGHYGTPYGAGPQYSDGGGDQYGYGPGYSYARQAPQLTNSNEPRQ